MSNIKLFSDSTCDLPFSEIERMDVGIIPLIVTFEEDSFRDGIDITPIDMFKMVKERKILPKTSAPSPIDFYNKFKPFVDDGKSVIYIGLSSKISTTIQNAKLAAEHLGNDKVHIIDSLNLCGAIGGLVRNAYNFANKGMTAEEVTKEIRRIVPNYKLFFTINTLDYLHMGGRCSSTEAIFGNMLGIKPIISMSADGLDVWKKTRGKKKAIKIMIDEAEKDKDKILFDEIHLAYAVGNEKEGHEIKNQLIEKTGITKFHEYSIGCVISSHCGEGTVGFGYYLK
ncbi:DegV family protein [Sedimentibacter sp. MB31-C6]|uniref:DegV family protein n=1 Tax=Sedimentibacter sp. MB31-C6 TaxID=3109366 RepID=UPI002DDD5AE7|nr:DegV family protein [Sedimentibacter sp. MB36-C1]WSI04557.1 DegV family protein [Sedimentibacter sp. MB36-C1]